MGTYRFRRRSFLASVGGAFGLSSLLSNLEASAEGQGSPPRFLLMFWPAGTIPYLFRPLAGQDYLTSPILQPFEQAGLRDELIVLYGLRDTSTANGAGGSEGGVVMRTTGANIPGTRMNGGESDDAVAGGPSIDQILTKNVSALQRPGTSAVNAIAEARVDSHETSCQCLSYGYETRSIESANPGGMITEHVPLLPELSPSQLFTKLFAGFMPGGSTDANRLTLDKALQLRKSVLDYALGELGRIRTLGPASERDKIEVHAEAIRRIETQLSEQMAGLPAACVTPATPDASLVAKSGSQFVYNNPEAAEDDSPLLAELGALHLGVIRAAFQCDISRVATFQWASAVNQASFKGLYPDDPEACYRHHPLSHRVSGAQLETRPTNATQASIMDFLGNVQTWFNRKTAEALAAFKNSQDVFGGSLLDHTIVPFVTDTAMLNHVRSPLPTLILGGRALGMKGGQYLDISAEPRPHNDVWLSVAQAYLPDAESVRAALANETFVKQTISSEPIDGLWEKPA